MSSPALSCMTSHSPFSEDCPQVKILGQEKLKNSQIIKSVLDAADRKAACSVTTAHTRTAAVEEKERGVRATHSTTPIVAALAHIHKHGIPVVVPAASQS